MFISYMSLCMKSTLVYLIRDACYRAFNVLSQGADTVDIYVCVLCIDHIYIYIYIYDMYTRRFIYLLIDYVNVYRYIYIYT